MTLSWWPYHEIVSVTFTFIHSCAIYRYCSLHMNGSLVWSQQSIGQLLCKFSCSFTLHSNEVKSCFSTLKESDWSAKLTNSVTIIFPTPWQTIYFWKGDETVTMKKSEYLADLFSFHIASRSLRLRSLNHLHVEVARTSFASRQFRHAAPFVWNSLPAHLTDFSLSLDSLKKTA